MRHLIVAALLVGGLVLEASAEVNVVEPWVRATVPTQKATGAFMSLTAERDTRLVSAQTPVAGIVEMHETRMEGDFMAMRPLPHGVDLPAGKSILFKPGSYHFMLLNLKQPIAEGTTVPMQLTFEDKTGKQEVVNIKATVRGLGK